MERRIRTVSGIRAQRAVKRKFPNGNPDVTDWFRLGRSGSGNFARERIENVAMVGEDENGPGTGREEPHISHPFCPPLPHLLSVFIVCCLRFAIALREWKSGESRNLSSKFFRAK